MKNIALTLTLFLATLFANLSNAQSPIKNLNEPEYPVDDAYYKDIDSILNPFVGTWILNNGEQYLKLVFEKKTMFYNGSYYEDLLIGEIQYKENGVELVNTLGNLSSNLSHLYHHSIYGNNIRNYNSPFADYTSDNFRIELLMEEPSGASGLLDVRIAEVNGQPAIQIFRRGGEIVALSPSDPEPPEAIIPVGFFYLIQQ